MTTVAVSMVRDEADVIATTVAHMLREVDAVIVADNLSTDETRPILEAIAAGSDGRLVIVDDPDPGYRQSEKMTRLAELARLRLGAEWIVPFDADEVHYSPFGRITDVLAELAPQWLVAPAQLFDHVATGLDDPDELDPVRRLGWRRTAPAPLPKIACRWRKDLTIEQGNHGASYRGGATIVNPSPLVVRHFPYRSVEQLVRKVRNGAAAYAAAPELSADFGTHWRQWGALLEGGGPPALEELFRTWYWREDPTAPLTIGDETQPPLIFDPAPLR